MTPTPLTKAIEAVRQLITPPPPPPTSHHLPNLPTATERALYTITRNLMSGSGRLEARTLHRHPLPQALAHRIAAVRRLRRRRLLLPRPELHTAHDADWLRFRDEVAPRLWDYLDELEAELPRPTELDGFGVRALVAVDIAAMEHALRGHQLRRRWRIDDLAAVWLVDDAAGGG